MQQKIELKMVPSNNNNTVVCNHHVQMVMPDNNKSADINLDVQHNADGHGLKRKSTNRNALPLLTSKRVKIEELQVPTLEANCIQLFTLVLGKFNKYGTATNEDHDIVMAFEKLTDIIVNENECVLQEMEVESISSHDTLKKFMNMVFLLLGSYLQVRSTNLIKPFQQKKIEPNIRVHQTSSISLSQVNMIRYLVNLILSLSTYILNRKRVLSDLLVIDDMELKEYVDVLCKALNFLHISEYSSLGTIQGCLDICWNVTEVTASAVKMFQDQAKFMSQLSEIDIEMQHRFREECHGDLEKLETVRQQQASSLHHMLSR